LPPSEPRLAGAQASGARRLLAGRRRRRRRLASRGITEPPRLQYPAGQAILEQGRISMYATYHLNADELNADTLQSLKNTFQNQEIVILPKETYEEWERERHNAAFTEKLLRGMRDIEEGRGIVKTIAELRAMEDA
jgi:hypothetical protein